MRKSAITIAGVAALLGAALPAVPAHAYSAVTYVASNGSDATGCQHAAPCATIGFALSNTPDGGTVRCIDPLSDVSFQNTVTITRSVTIDCSGVNGTIARTGALGFIINAPGAAVTLRGLSITSLTDTKNGNFPGGPGAIGVDILAAASVTIEDCLISGFTANAAQGIRIAPTSGFTTVTITNTLIINNGLGIFALGAQGLLVTLSRVTMVNNAFGGFRASGAGSGVFANIVDSIANDNGTNGFVATSPAGGSAVVFDIQRSNPSLNQQAGILSDGAPASITIGSSMVTANATGFTRTNGGAIISYGDNRVDNNSVNGSPSGTAGTM